MMDGSGTFAPTRLSPDATFAPVSARAPGLPGPSGPPRTAPAPKRRPPLLAALAVSALLHGATALALTLAPSLRGSDAAGETGADQQSLPEQPALMVELLTPADLVSDAQPQIGAEPAIPMPQPLADTAPDLAFSADPAPLAPSLMALDVLVAEKAPTQVQLPPKPEPEPEPKLKAEKPAKAKAKPADAPKPKAKAQPDSGGKTAKGTGNGTQAGTDGKAKVSTGLTKAQLADLKAEWGAKVRNRIERKRAYPKSAKGAAGTVKVRITVAASGKLISVSVAASSGNAALDGAAVKAVKAAGKFPAAPKGLSDASYSFTLPMKFQP